jgi:hypothetical protein
MTKAIDTLGWDSKVIFVHSHNYGPEEYAVIPWLLLYFGRVAVYGPAASQVRSAFSASGENSFTLEEFQAAIEEGLIVPIAFDTFTDREQRTRGYSKDLQIQEAFDESLLDTGTSLGRALIRVGSDFKPLVSGPAAMEYIAEHPEFRTTVETRLKRAETCALPSRYERFRRGEMPVPEPLLAHVGNSDVVTKLTALIVYDSFNRQHVMGKLGTEFTHLTPGDFTVERIIQPVYPASFFPSEGLDVQVPAWQLAQEIRLALGLFQMARKERVSLDFVRRFRAKHKERFVADLSRIMLEGMRTGDDERRRARITDRVRYLIKEYEAHFSVGPEFLIKVLEMVRLSQASDLLETLLKGPPESKRRAIWDGLHTSLGPRGRWVYALLHES